MKARLSLATLLVLVFLGVVLALLGVLILPWRAPASPRGEELATRWREIEIWAGMSALTGDTGAIVKADLAVERRHAEISALSRPQILSPAGQLREDDLPEEGRIALRALESWDAAGAGLGADPCGEALTAVPALTMGELLLAVAGKDPRAPELGRALRLAAALRTSGDLGLVTIGFNLAEQAVSWAQARRLGPSAPFIEHRPRAAEIFVAASRDAVCTVQRAQAAIGQRGLRGLLGELGPEASPMWVRPLLDPARELDALRAFHVVRLGAAAAEKDSFGRLRAHLRMPAHDDLPSAALVRGMVKDPGELFERWREVFERYDAWVDAPER